jgi:hypothetical protein
LFLGTTKTYELVTFAVGEFQHFRCWTLLLILTLTRCALFGVLRHIKTHGYSPKEEKSGSLRPFEIFKYFNYQSGEKVFTESAELS